MGLAVSDYSERETRLDSKRAPRASIGRYACAGMAAWPAVSRPLPKSCGLLGCGFRSVSHRLHRI
jgi:hypothetical protein